METPRTKVYRVQDAEGRGPWKPGFSALWAQPRKDHDNLKPIYPPEKLMLKMHRHGMICGCGCETIDQLRRWFTLREWEWLKFFGYRAVMIDVDSIIARDETQVVFARKKPLNQDAVVVDLYETVRRIDAI